MTDVGLDWAWVTPNLDEVWAAGYRFVSRYLSYDTTGKNLTAAELASLRTKGFEVAANWEWYGDWAHDYSGGAANGATHAAEAVSQARALGYPAGCTIYFSVDFQETNGQIAAVDDYTRAARDVVHASGYRMGAYGGIATISQLFDAGLIDDGWQTYAWSNGQWDGRAAIRQDQNDIVVGGAQCDHNTRVGQTYLMGQSTVEAEMAAVIQTSDKDGNTVFINPTAHTWCRVPKAPAGQAGTFWPLQNKLDAYSHAAVTVVDGASMGWSGGYDFTDPATWVWAGVEVQPAAGPAPAVDLTQVEAAVAAELGKVHAATTLTVE